MKTSQSIKQIMVAMNNVQQGIEIIKRDDQADAGKFSYKYAGMPRIWIELKPLLKKHELTVIQSPTTGDNGVIGDFLTTTIYHSSGEFIQDSMRLVVTRDDPQGVGAAITYARRYAITAMFGIVTDDDNDATTQRLADGDMKKDWVRAYTVMAKKMNPEAIVTNNGFIEFMVGTYGKHPSKVLAKEHQQVLDTINAFND